MSRVAVQCVDGLLAPDEVSEMVRIWHRFPFYDAVNKRPSGEAAAPALAGRFAGLVGRTDVEMHFRETGCAAGRAAMEAGLARVNYFRANYVYHDESSVPGVEKFLDNGDFVEAARLIFDLPLVVPTLLYANVLTPGQELPVHTDIPEFLGADRTQLPAWLLVAMHHSGLFDDRRIATATAIAYVEGGIGGEFAYFEQGERRTVSPRPGVGVVLDADSVFHAILPVGEDDDLPPADREFMRLSRDGHRRWKLSTRSIDPPEVMGTYTSEQLRFSVSLKAYCFADERELRAWQDGVEPLDLDRVLGRLTDELIARRALDSPDHGLSDHEVATLLIREFVPFPD
jgi:hypothetical protein